MKIKIVLICLVISVLGLNSCLSSRADEVEIVKMEKLPRIMDITIPSEDYNIRATYVLPTQEDPFPLVLMHHGHGGNREEGGMFDRYAERLADKGIASIRMDFVGCGESELPFRENRIKNMIADSYTVLDWVLSDSRIDTERLGLLGYSMGGRMALLMTSEDNPFTNRISPYKAYVLLAPGTRPFPDNFDVLYEQARADGFYSLPWFGGILELGVGWFEDMEYANTFVQNIQGRRKKSLIIAGGNDALRETNKQTAEAIGADFFVIPEATHGFGFWSDQPEVRDAVVREVTDFFIENL